MQIVSKQGPAIPFVDKPGSQSDSAKATRERAIQAFIKGSAPESSPNTVQEGTTVQNASNVSPEEMTGIKQSVAAPETIKEVGQSDTNEATHSTQVEEPLSPRYALLARKEKALRSQVQKLNAERAAFKAEQEALKGARVDTQPTFDESKYLPRDRIAQDPITVLEELGFSREDVANRLLNADQVSPATATYLKKLEKEIADLKTAQDESKKTFESNQAESYNQAITAMEYEAEELVKSDPEFATIKETGQYKEIVNLIKDVHAKGLPGVYRQGTLLSVDQAARLVEDELVNQWVEQHDKLSRLEKIQKRLKSATQSAKPSQSTQGTQAQNQPADNKTKTLTNSMSTGRKLTARERAIAVFNGNK